MHRRIEITAIERERIVSVTRHFICPVCNAPSEILTVAQAAAFAQVKTCSVLRWLANNQAHGPITSGFRRRVCRNSLFRQTPSEGIRLTDNVTDADLTADPP